MAPRRNHRRRCSMSSAPVDTIILRFDHVQNFMSIVKSRNIILSISWIKKYYNFYELIDLRCENCTST